MAILQFPRSPRAKGSSARSEAHAVQYRTIHGYRRAFVHVGSGPAILLIHGIGDRSDTFRGLIEVLVDQQGRVADVRMLERIAPSHDKAVTEAAWGWTFEPARLNDQPVRFRHQIQIVLRPKEVR